MEDDPIRMKISILADSLALPREDVAKDRPFEVTYPYLLDQSFRRRFGANAPLVMERGMRRRTIEYVLDEWTEQVELKSPEVVIVHVGVVDCAPRVFLRREHAFVARIKLRFLRERILKFAHDHRRAIILKRPRVYVPLPRFEKHVIEVVQRAQRDKVRLLVFINIISPPDSVEERSPGFQSNVDRYNQVLAQQAKHPHVALVDLNGLLHREGGSAGLTVDGVHLTERGHMLIAQQLDELVTPLVERELQLTHVSQIAK